MSLNNPASFLENIINNTQNIDIDDQDLKKNLSVVSKKLKVKSSLYVFNSPFSKKIIRSKSGH